MGSQYPYFVSTLPHLRRGARPPVSSAAFLEQCAEQVSPAEYAALAAVSLEPRSEAACPAEARWNSFETCLRNTAARLRAARLRQDAAAVTRPDTDGFASLEVAVPEAFGRSPLALEEQFDLLRWRFLDDLGVTHDLDFTRLFLYRVKLLLLEKRAALDAAAGRRALERDVAAKLDFNLFAGGPTPGPAA